jgi:CubicO group peptidase (beta-lactamase class C family)
MIDRPSLAAVLGNLVPGFIEEASIPAAGVAVVSSDRLVAAEAFGLRDIESGQAMTTDTAFPIASTTKSMNATLLAMLVDEGLLAWDEPVRTYIPEFALADPVRSNLVTLRDLVSMRTGLPRHDWVWMDREFGRSELVEKLRHLELAAPFRSRFLYNNLTVCLAGHIAERATGESWCDLMQKRLLTPLEMGSTSFAPNPKNRLASYHHDRLGKLVASRQQASRLTAPSGGLLHSTIIDLSKWAMFNLATTRTSLKPGLSAHCRSELVTPQIALGEEFTEIGKNASYGLGWIIDEYNEVSRIWHAGLLSDVNTCVALFPSENIAIVAVTNARASAFAARLAELVFDKATNRTSLWSLGEKLEANRRRVETQRSRMLESSTSEESMLPLPSYVGTYAHPAYGELSLRTSGAMLQLSRYGTIVHLVRKEGVWLGAVDDDFPLDPPHPFDHATPIRFECQAGTVHAVSISFEPSASPIRFDRVVDRG